MRFFRKDGHNWRKKSDGKTVRETHEKLKAQDPSALPCLAVALRACLPRIHSVDRVLLRCQCLAGGQQGCAQLLLRTCRGEGLAAGGGCFEVSPC